ncbi:MAG TPA: PP2C family protein-serine/threonine phosphatase, partial [Acidobacteriaceae bacterium]|nr:PP2C family protein-serine/threonine phosphatase [Acidobacteriaceae bacterium]
LKRQQAMEEDVKQAREIQQILIPEKLPNLPGWTIDSEYRPARQVGGDFFQVMPEADGSLLIVVGDVSGKGLKAAMTVSAIVGALRDSQKRRPAQVLAHLNRVLCGQIGGFVTCSATLISEDGAIAIANAGHLPPYRNGEELPVANSLPLGVSAEVSYDEKHFNLAPGDRVVFVSDGVAEARDSKGELLGFDRMAALIGQSATAIAEAAQRWGQEDDITVLAIERAAAMQPAPV